MSGRTEKILLAGASLPLTEGIMAGMHGGFIGAVLAAGLSSVIFVAAEEYERYTGREVSLPRLPKRRERQPGEYTFAEKLLNGKSYREARIDDDYEEEDEEDGGLWVPPPFRLEDVLEFIAEFNQEHSIYFGESEEGSIAIPMSKMYHVMDVSSSGAGKSNRLRHAMMQMVNHCQCYYINPIASPVKAVEDDREIEVWQPIFDRLANKGPVKEGPQIEDLLKRLTKEIKRRNEMENRQDFSWMKRPIFVFVDELPEVFALCPDAISRLDKIGRMGRNYGVFCWVAGQTALVEEIGQSTASQANYKTRIYGGGDQTSANRLMKGGVSDEMERALLANGAGLTLMLAEGIAKPLFVRAPLMTNEGMFAYLKLGEFRIEDWTRGKKKKAASGYASQASSVSTSVATSQRRSNLYLVDDDEAWNEAGRSGDEVDEADEASDEVENDPFSGLSDREQEIIEMFVEQQKTPGQIAKVLCGGKGGDAFQKAAVEVSDAIRKYTEILRGA